MPQRKTSIPQRMLQVLAVFAIVGVSIAGIQLLAASPCEIPRTWSVGRVDAGFNLSKQMAAQYGKEATDVWNAAYPEGPLFVYRENGGEVTLNFEYDERMQTTIRNQRLKRNITEGKSELSEIKETLESLRAEYDSLERNIAALTKTYDSRLNAYNKEVAYWNSRGGAPKAEFATLEAEGKDLEAERGAINAKIQYYNQLADRIRNYGEDHNEIVATLNNQITTLNETSLREFEEGIFNPNNNSITIYEYPSPASLKRVLIHEFGHALSIGHVEGEDSIMYPVNQGRGLDFSDEDLAELQRVCQEKDLRGILRASNETVELIRGGISRLVELSSPGTAALLK